MSDRIDTLERSLARTRLLSLGSTALCGALLLLGLAGPAARVESRLDVERLRLVDSEGRVRAVLAASDGGAQLVLGDEDGQRIVLCSTDEDLGGWFFDAHGAERVALSANDGDLGLYLQGPDGHDRLSVVASPEDLGLYFRDDRGLYVPRPEDPELLLVTGVK